MKNTGSRGQDRVKPNGPCLFMKVVAARAVNGYFSKWCWLSIWPCLMIYKIKFQMNHLQKHMKDKAIKLLENNIRQYSFYDSWVGKDFLDQRQKVL